MILKNAFLEIELDDGNGSILSLTDRKRGITYTDDARGCALYRLVVPDNEKWLGQFADSTAAACEISSSRYDTCMHFAKQRTDEGRELDISVTVKVTLRPDCDEAFLSFRVENNSPFVIDEVWFPQIGGLHVDRRRDNDVACFGYAAPFSLRNCKGKAGYNLMNSTRKTTFWSGIPLFHIQREGRGGIALNHYATIPQQCFGMARCLSFGADELTVSFAHVLHPFVGPGETFCSETFGLSCNKGLQDTLDRYKEFLRGMPQPARPPKRLADAVALYSIQLRDFEGRRHRRADSLPAAAEELAALGIRDVCVWDMMFENYLRAGNGFFMEEEPASARRELRDAVRQMVGKGMNVSTLVNFRLVNESLNGYEDRVRGTEIKSRYGRKAMESYCIRSSTATYFNGIYEEQGHPLCQNSDVFQRFAVGLGKEIVEEYGFNSLFIDQPFGQHYCFDRSHGHKFGADDETGAIQWVSRLQEELHATEGYQYSIGEVPDIFNTRVIELWWHWPWNALNPAVIRYVLPSSLQTWVIDAKEHGSEITRAFSLGFLLALHTGELNETADAAPDVAKRVKNLKALKDKLGEAIAYDKFIGGFGIGIRSDIAIEANAYETEDTYAVIFGCAEDPAYVAPGGEEPGGGCSGAAGIAASLAAAAVLAGTAALLLIPRKKNNRT